MENQLPMSYADHEAPEAAAEYLSSALMTPENVMLPYDYQSFISSELFRHICLAVSSSSSSQMVDSEANSSDAPAAAVMATDDGLADDYQAQADHPIPESDNETDVLVIKCKILHHPLFPRLLRAYVDCQKFTGRPSEAGFADEIEPWDEDISAVLGSDPQLDEFMETYCEILEKHNEDLCSTISSVTSFLNTTEMQLADLCGALLMTSISENVYEDAEEGIIPSPEEEQPAAGADDDQTSKCSTKAKSDLKMNLLSKYGCAQVSNLKLEFSKRIKKKKGKLPCRSRQVLVNWWNSHHSWPYPSEADKVELTGMTGLLPKQINNWFINQRKRHWRAPAESLRYSWIDNNLSAGTGSGKTND